MTGSEGYNLRVTASKEPEIFGWISTMAITAAAMDKWDGLYYLMLATIASGRPGDTIKMHERYKDTLRIVQGRSRADLTSWDRIARLASRVQGEGLTPLGAINIAAHTLLDSFQSHVMLDMLDSQFDADFISHSVQNDIYDILSRASKSGASKGDTSTYQKYKKNVRHIQFAVLCYHPNAFIERVKGYARTQDWTSLGEIWEKLLKASKGENAFVRARDLREYGSQRIEYQEIPISPEIWRELSQDFRDQQLTVLVAFIYAFRRQGSALEISQIINLYLPERNLDPSPKILGVAMKNLLLISESTPGISPETRQLARDEAVRIWESAQKRGIAETDEMLEARFRSLDLTKQHRELARMAQRLQNRQMPLGTMTARALLTQYLKSGDLNAAENLLIKGPDRGGDHNSLHLAYSRGYDYKTFLKHLLASPRWDIEAKLKSIARVKILFSQSVKPFESWGTKGLILCSILDKAKTYNDPTKFANYVNLAKRQIFEDIKAEKIFSYKPFSDLMTAILTRYDARYKPDDLDFSISAEILEQAVEYKNDLTYRRAQSFWALYFRCAAESVLDNFIMRKYIDRGMRSLEMVIGTVPLKMRYNIIQALLTRKDGKGGSEAVRRWDELKKHYPNVRPKWWIEVVYSCLRADRRDVAELIVHDAWVKQEVPINDEFWVMVRDNGLYIKAGIVEDELVKAMREGRKGKVVRTWSDEGDGSYHGGKLQGGGYDIDEIENDLETKKLEDGDDVDS